MSKRERGPDEEAEPGKRGKLRHEDVEARTDSGHVRSEQLKEDFDCGYKGGTRRKLEFSDAESPRAGAQRGPGVADAEGDLQHDYSSDSHPCFSSFSFYSCLPQMPRQGPPPPRVVRIADLRPELVYGTWQTRGSVVYKTPVLDYDNEKGSGSYFWFEIKDNDGGEIRIICFNWNIDKFFNEVVEGKEYVFSNSMLKEPDDRYNWKKRPCEMILGYNSVIRAVRQEGGTEGVESETLTAGATQTQKEIQDAQTEKEIQDTQTEKETQDTQTEKETQGTQTEKETEYTQTQNENEYLRKRLAEVELKFEIINSQVQDCRLQIEQLKAKAHVVSL